MHRCNEIISYSVQTKVCHCQSTKDTLTKANGRLYSIITLVLFTLTILKRCMKIICSKNFKPTQVNGPKPSDPVLTLLFFFVIEQFREESKITMDDVYVGARAGVCGVSGRTSSWCPPPTFLFWFHRSAQTDHSKYQTSKLGRVFLTTHLYSRR